MPLGFTNLPVAALLAAGAAAVLALLAFLLTVIFRALKGKPAIERVAQPPAIEAVADNPAAADETGTGIEPVSLEREEPTQPQSFSGEEFDQFFLHLVSFLIFGALALIILLAFIAPGINVSIQGLWPFILVLLLMLLGSFIVIDWSKLRSKRTVQREMREI